MDDPEEDWKNLMWSDAGPKWDSFSALEFCASDGILYHNQFLLNQGCTDTSTGIWADTI